MYRKLISCKHTLWFVKAVKSKISRSRKTVIGCVDTAIPTTRNKKCSILLNFPFNLHRCLICIIENLISSAKKFKFTSDYIKENLIYGFLAIEFYFNFLIQNSSSSIFFFPPCLSPFLSLLNFQLFSFRIK